MQAQGQIFNPRPVTENRFEAEQKRAQRRKQNLHDLPLEFDVIRSRASYRANRQNVR